MPLVLALLLRCPLECLFSSLAHRVKDSRIGSLNNHYPRSSFPFSSQRKTSSPSTILCTGKAVYRHFLPAPPLYHSGANFLKQQANSFFEVEEGIPCGTSAFCCFSQLWLTVTSLSLVLSLFLPRQRNHNSGFRTLFPSSNLWAALLLQSVDLTSPGMTDLVIFGAPFFFYFSPRAPPVYFFSFL